MKHFITTPEEAENIKKLTVIFDDLAINLPSFVKNYSDKFLIKLIRFILNKYETHKETAILLLETLKTCHTYKNLLISDLCLILESFKNKFFNICLNNINICKIIDCISNENKLEMLYLCKLYDKNIEKIFLDNYDHRIRIMNITVKEIIENKPGIYENLNFSVRNVLRKIYDICDIKIYLLGDIISESLNKNRFYLLYEHQDICEIIYDNIQKILINDLSLYTKLSFENLELDDLKHVFTCLKWNRHCNATKEEKYIEISRNKMSCFLPQYNGNITRKITIFSDLPPKLYIYKLTCLTCHKNIIEEKNNFLCNSCITSHSNFKNYIFNKWLYQNQNWKIYFDKIKQINFFCFIPKELLLQIYNNLEQLEILDPE
jgi:hypothetical protein